MSQGEALGSGWAGAGGAAARVGAPAMPTVLPPPSRRPLVALVGVEDLVRAHWAKYGRNFYTRHAPARGVEGRGATARAGVGG